MPTYNRADLEFERGDGAWLFTADGRRYLDFASGIAVTALGHSHPHLVAALTEQAKKVWHTSNLYRVPGQETLAAMIGTTRSRVNFLCGNLSDWDLSTTRTG